MSETKRISKIFLISNQKIMSVLYITNIPTDLDVSKIKPGRYYFDTGDDRELRIRLINRLCELSKSPAYAVRTYKPDDDIFNRRYLTLSYDSSVNDMRDSYMHNPWEFYAYHNAIFDYEFPTTVDKDFNIIESKKRSKEERHAWNLQIRCYNTALDINCKEWPKKCEIKYCPGYHVKVSKDDPHRYQKFHEKFYITSCCDKIVHRSCQDRKWKYLSDLSCKACLSRRESFGSYVTDEVALALDGFRVYKPINYENEDITE